MQNTAISQCSNQHVSSASIENILTLRWSPPALSTHSQQPLPTANMTTNLTVNAVNNLQQLGTANDRNKVYDTLNLVVKVTNIGTASNNGNNLRYNIGIQDGSNGTMRCFTEQELSVQVQQNKVLQESVIRIREAKAFLHVASRPQVICIVTAADVVYTPPASQSIAAKPPLQQMSQLSPTQGITQRVQQMHMQNNPGGMQSGVYQPLAAGTARPAAHLAAQQQAAGWQPQTPAIPPRHPPMG